MKKKKIRIPLFQQTANDPDTHTHTRSHMYSVLSTHRVSQDLLRLSQRWSGLQLHFVATFVVGGGRRLGQIREVFSRPGASEADLVQALQHGQHRAPGLYLNMADGNPEGTQNTGGCR